MKTPDGSRLPLEDLKKTLAGTVRINSSPYVATDCSGSLFLTRESEAVMFVPSQEGIQLHQLGIDFVSEKDDLKITLPLESTVQQLHNNVHSFHVFSNARIGGVGDCLVLTNQYRIQWLRISQSNVDIEDITDQIPYTITSIESTHNVCVLLTSDNQILTVGSNKRRKKVFKIKLTNPPRTTTMMEFPLGSPIKRVRGYGDTNFLLTLDGRLFKHPLIGEFVKIEVDLPIIIQDFRMLSMNSRDYRAMIKDDIGNFHCVIWYGDFIGVKLKPLDIHPKYEFKPYSSRLTKSARSSNYSPRSIQHQEDT